MKHLLLILAIVLSASTAAAQGYTLELDWDIYGDPPSSSSNPMNPWQHVCDDLNGFVIVEKVVGSSTTFNITTVMIDDNWLWGIQNINSVVQGGSSTVSSSMFANPATGLWLNMTTAVDASGGQVKVEVLVSFWLNGEWFYVGWGIDYTDFDYTGAGSEPEDTGFYFTVIPPRGYDPDDPDFRNWFADTEWWVQ